MSPSPIDRLTLTRPDDWHIHLRDGEALPRTVNDAAGQFARAIVMPNLLPPVTDVAAAGAYRERILGALSGAPDFEPLMVLYLTDQTDASCVAEAAASPFVHAFKWYPAGATTNSASGVTDINKIYPALEAMQKHDVVLSIHGEVTDHDIDIFDREAIFIERTLKQVRRDFPSLKIVFEHITTAEAVDFVRSCSDNTAATITAHHLLFNRNDLLAGAVRPHYYCLPVLKRSTHQHALLDAASSGDKRFFLGTDSAPHSKDKKETACGCAGCYTAHNALALYATAFESVSALHALEGFASFYGADFYKLPRNQGKITLLKQPIKVPPSLDMGGQALVPMLAGETLGWQLERAS
ncbi:MAG: dihydroorotase [Pseudomonadales bacterium]|nr:dihydroorotase [Pseudomonadales bacterium]